MQSGKSRSPYSYLQRVLNDGAKPFRYRTGVYSLLGIADSQMKGLASGLMNLSSMGLPHANVNVIRSAYIAGKSRKPILPDQFSVTVNDNSACTSGNSHEYIKKKGGNLEYGLSESRYGNSGKLNDLDEKTTSPLIQHMKQPGDSFLNVSENLSKGSPLEPDYSQGFEPEDQNKIFAEESVQESPEIAEGASIKISQTDQSVQDSIERKPYSNVMHTLTPGLSDQEKAIEIPGISVKQVTFTALAVNKSMENAEKHFQRLDDENTSKKESHEQAVPKPGVQNSGSIIMNYTAKQDEASYNFRKKSPAWTLQYREQNNKFIIKPAVKKNDLPIGYENNKVNQEHITTSWAGILSNPDVNHLLPSQDISREVAAGNIEQIRRSVQEYYSKINQKHGKKECESEDVPADHQITQNLQMPVKPVVVIKRGSGQGRMQLAFWERSYLGRFNMMPLR